MDRPSPTPAQVVRTFAHIGDPVPAPDHSVFWKAWYARLIAHTPALVASEHPDPSDPGATHEFDSIDGVTIGGRLVLPSDGRPVRAALVTVHGDHIPDPLAVNARRWQGVADRGVAVLLVRLRGYPGSRTTCGDLTTSPDGGHDWITRGLDGESHEAWILPKGVADVCNACRAMRNALLHRETGTSIEVDSEIDHPAVYLHGSSLGGGIAVIAAAQLIGKLPGEAIVDRLAIATPSLGDWGGRLAHPTGTAVMVRKVIDAHPQRRDELLARLKLCDAVVHGRRVRVPTFAMLAHHDDVVPPACAAAVFNAIDADPGRKWRFQIERGHPRPGLVTPNTRRIALYARALRDFFDPARRPIDAMSSWEGRMALSADRGSS